MAVEKCLHDDIDKYFQFATDQGHKYWTYFQVVVAAITVFVFSETAKVLAARTTTTVGPYLADLACWLAFAVAGFAAINRLLLLGNQAATCEAWKLLQGREVDAAQPSTRLLAYLKPLPVQEVYFAHLALTWVVVAALLGTNWVVVGPHSAMEKVTPSLLGAAFIELSFYVLSYRRSRWYRLEKVESAPRG